MNEIITKKDFKEWCYGYFTERPKYLIGLTLKELAKRSSVYHYSFTLPSEANNTKAFEKIVPRSLGNEIIKYLECTPKSVRDRVGFNISNKTINLFSSFELNQELQQILNEKFELAKKQALSRVASLPLKDDNDFDDFVYAIRALTTQEKAKAIIQNRSVMDMISETMESVRGRRSGSAPTQNPNRKLEVR